MREFNDYYLVVLRCELLLAWRELLLAGFKELELMNYVYYW